MIEIIDAVKSYKNKIAINNISFKAPSHSITGLLGLNGAGKTTLLKSIASIHYVDSGKITINGIDSVEQALENKKQIGFVVEQNGLNSDFTVYEVLLQDASIQLFNANYSARSDAVQNVISLCSLEDVLFTTIKTLSKGYKQRLLFARALLSNPPVILLDEPTSGLDPKQIVEMRELINKLSINKTILISTHLMQEVQALCINIAILHEGNLLAYGTEKEICSKVGVQTIENAFLKLTSSIHKEDYDKNV